jgi:hypothetical protein
MGRASPARVFISLIGPTGISTDSQPGAAVAFTPVVPTVSLDGCLLRLLQKPVGDGPSPAQGDAGRLLRWWWPATTTPCFFGLQRILGLGCNFYLFLGPLHSMAVTAASVFFKYVSVFVHVFVCFPYLEIQIRIIKKTVALTQ